MSTISSVTCGRELLDSSRVKGETSSLSIGKLSDLCNVSANDISKIDKLSAEVAQGLLM